MAARMRRPTGSSNELSPKNPSSGRGSDPESLFVTGGNVSQLGLFYVTADGGGESRVSPSPGMWPLSRKWGILVTSMEQDSFHIYGPNGHAVAVILSQAAEMTLSQIAAIAKTSDSTTGYFGRNARWRNAGRAAQGAAETNSRTGFLSAAKDAAMDSVIKAVERIVVSENKSAAGISDCWRDYLAAISIKNPRARARAYRNLQKALIHSIGFKAAKAVPVASGAASSAAQVAVAWDLASERGGFTRADRDLLMAPWLTAFSLPPDLAARS
jgi:hypothetical protein